MKILAFDTATRATAVALVDTAGELSVEARDDPEPGARPRHTSRLMALVAEVLERAGCGWEEVERIGVGTGPGTFTGLRIGVASARALARARGIELVGVSTLQSLAVQAAESEAAQARDTVMALLDARRGEVFAAAWPTISVLGDPLLAPTAIAPGALAEATGKIGQNRLAVGDGAIAFRPVLGRSGTEIPGDDSDLHRVSAVYHCRLAGQLDPGPTEDVRPEYLRLPDAEIALRAEPTP